MADGLAREFPESNAGRGVRLESMHDTAIGSDLKVTSMLFLGVVGFVLLICCANVANLLMARASARTRELAVRAALGAGRRRIIRQLLTESLLLSVIGGGLGIALGAVLLRAAPALIPAGLLPGTVTLAFDLRVIAFCAAAALTIGVLFGLAPAWQATSISTTAAMGADTRTTTGAGGRLRSLLVIGEVATAVLLLFGAGLLLRTLMAVNSFDRGYRAESVLTMMVDPLGSSYPTPEKLQQFYDQVEAEVRTVPGVQDVAWSSALPLGDSLYGDFALTYEVVGDPQVPEAQRPTTNYQVVSPAYFSTVDLPIVAGRAFDSRDTRDSPRVCIVNEAFVRTLGGRSPIGMKVSFRVAGSPQDKPDVGEIVGVAKQVKGRPDEPKDFVQIYVPMAHDLVDDTLLMVRPKAGDAEALIPAVRAAISRIDKDQLVSVRDVVTLEDIAWASTGRHRFRAVLVTAFATLAVVLAMVGVFGILAYSVQQRVRDFGVRRALGATTGDVLRLVVSGALAHRLCRRSHRPDPGSRARPADRLGPVRSGAAGLRHLRGGDAAGGDDCGRVDRRPGLASDADRSCRRAADQVDLLRRAGPSADEQRILFLGAAGAPAPVGAHAQRAKGGLDGRHDGEALARRRDERLLHQRRGLVDARCQGGDHAIDLLGLRGGERGSPRGFLGDGVGLGDAADGSPRAPR